MTERAFTAREDRNCRCVTVTGDLDLSNARELSATLASLAAFGPLVVDLSGCTYLDSTGLSVFVRHERMHRGHLVIVAPIAHRSLRLLEITGLALTLTIVPTLAVAFAKYAERQLSA